MEEVITVLVLFIFLGICILKFALDYYLESSSMIINMINNHCFHKVTGFDVETRYLMRNEYFTYKGKTYNVDFVAEKGIKDSRCQSDYIHIYINDFRVTTVIHIWIDGEDIYRVDRPCNFTFNDNYHKFLLRLKKEMKKRDKKSVKPGWNIDTIGCRKGIEDD